VASWLHAPVVLQSLLVRTGVTASVTAKRFILSWNSLSVQSSKPSSRTRVIGSRIPLRRWACPRPCGFPRRRCREHSEHPQTCLSSDFAFLQSIPQFSLADIVSLAGKNINNSRGLPYPSAHSGNRDSCLTVLPSPSLPTSGFVYPLDGLIPLKPHRPYFMPAALLGFFTPFEVFSSRKVSGSLLPNAPACRFPSFWF
jgi:hypothetical protein